MTLHLLTILAVLPVVLSKPLYLHNNPPQDINFPRDDVSRSSGVVDPDLVHRLQEKVSLLTRIEENSHVSSIDVGPQDTQGGLLERQNDSSAELAQQLALLFNVLESLLEFLSGTTLVQPTADAVSSSTSSSSTSSSASQTIMPVTVINTTPVLYTTSSSQSSYLPTSTIAPSASTQTIAPRPSSSSSYTFNPMASDLNVVYYAQTVETNSVPLLQICQDPDIDIVILAFVTNFFGPGGYPTVNFGPKCWASNSAQSSAGATGLLDCVSDGFAAQVSACQNLGKKVMLSLGGAVSDTTIPNDAAAQELATTLWKLFLGGTNNATTNPLRPFGTNVVLDGIDVDNETPINSAHIPTLVSSLRSLFSTATTTNPTKPYYLSAAPQCPRPDQSIPIPSLLTSLDFVSVQFYNNPSCNLNSGQSFLDSLSAWSNDLMATNNDTAEFVSTGNGVTSGPRLLIGTPAFSAAGTGFVDVPTYAQILQQVKMLELGNLGGAMFWDGAYQEVSGGAGGDGGGRSYASVVREVLG